MSSYAFYEKTDEQMTKENLFELLKQKMVENKLDTTELDIVYDFCQKLYTEQKRYSGDEYITHLLNVSLILVQMGAKESVVYAGMFCDAFQKTDISIDDIKKYLTKDVSQIIICLRDYDIEKDRLSDEECAVIKMAERLHNMRTIEYMEESEKKKRNNLYLYAGGKKVKKRENNKRVE